MRYPRSSAVAVSSLLILLTTTGAAYGQRITGGGRIGGHLGAGVRGQAGGNIAAPRLRGGAETRPVPQRVTPGVGLDRVGVGGGYRSRLDVPHRGRLLALPGDGFHGFGFPHHHFGLFLDGFGFFSGFPFFPGFAPFDPFSRDRTGLFRAPRRHLGIPETHRRRVRFFHHQPFFPFGGFFGWVPFFGIATGSDYSSVSTEASLADEPTAAREVSLGQQLELRGVAEGDTLEVERVSLMDVVPRAVLRVTWRNRDLPAAQVALFLADSSQGVLSAQTIRAPPFTALFEPQPGTAFVGLTVVWPDGTLSTRFVPYKKGPR